LFAALAVFAGVASAATLSVTCLPDPVLGSPNLSGATLTCDRFDNSLGILTSIEITVEGTVVGSIVYTNSNPTPQVVTGSGETQYSISPLLAGFAFVNPIFSAAFPAGAVVPASDSTTVPIAGAGSITATNGNALTFGDYTSVGPGTFFFDLSSETFFSLLLPTGVDASPSTEVTGRAELIYTFDEVGGEVPEPGTFALLGGGLMLMATTAYRRRRAQ
jgi:hypothetical protein